MQCNTPKVVNYTMYAVASSFGTYEYCPLVYLYAVYIVLIFWISSIYLHVLSKVLVSRLVLSK